MNRQLQALKATSEDEVFKAIADPTRRALLDRLRSGPTSVGVLAEGFDCSRPAISKHLKVLSEAGLIQGQMVGREHVFELHASALRPVTHWVDSYRTFWQTSLKNLKRHLEKS